MKINLPNEVKQVIETLGNKSKRLSAIKIYAAMLMRSNRTDMCLDILIAPQPILCLLILDTQVY